MFNELATLVKSVESGATDQGSVSQAAQDHVSDMDHAELTQNLQAAASSANQNGQADVAQQIASLIEQNGTNPQGLKQAAVSLIASNPQILEHFMPDFAKGIVGRL